MGTRNALAICPASGSMALTGAGSGSAKAASIQGTLVRHKARADGRSPVRSKWISRAKRAVAKWALAAMAPTSPCATVANICKSSPASATIAPWTSNAW